MVQFFQAFLDAHVKSSHYRFQLKICPPAPIVPWMIYPLYHIPSQERMDNTKTLWR